MIREEVLTISKDDFSANAAFDGDVITASIEGNGDHRARSDLERFVDRVEAEAQRFEVSEVTIDLRRLEFLNSSCFKTLVGWITRVEDLVPAKQHRIRFVSNPSILWQRRSMHALASLASEVVVIDAEGP